MKSDNSINTLNEILFTMLSESDKEVIPRIIMVDNRSKLWRLTVSKAIDLDSAIFKSDDYILTCRRYLNDELELRKFKGNLNLALHNVLTCIDDTDNMIITVENLVHKYFKGKKIQRSIKLVYIVLQT
jgi:hypothetical protein